MKLPLLTFLAFFPLSINSFMEANSIEPFTLIKRNENYLHRPLLVSPLWPSSFNAAYTASPLFVRLPTQEVLMIESGAGLTQSMGYFFSSNGKLNRIIKPLPSAALGNPGAISGVTTLFVTENNVFGTYDNSKRVNFYDSTGVLRRSILIPVTIDSCVVITASFNNNTLALAGRDMVDGFPAISIFDYDKPSNNHVYYSFLKNVYEQAQTKGRRVASYINVYATVLSSGQTVCNVGSTPDIHLISKDGSSLVESTSPPHYHPLSEAEMFDSSWQRIDETGNPNEEMSRWFSTWTHSYRVYEYSDKKLIVPRILSPTVYLDLYSFSDDEINYLGYASTDKPFLFADSSGVYLLEERNDTSLAIGKYEIVPSNYREDEWTIKEFTQEELSRLKKNTPDTSEPCDDCPREKYRPKGYLTKLDRVKMLNTDGIEYSLIDSLKPAVNHVILFSTPQDCFFVKAFQAAQNYLKENSISDLTIVFTHPYPSELNEFMYLAKLEWNCQILANTDWKLLAPVLKSTPCFLVVSENGKIMFDATLPDFEPKPREKK